MKLLPSWTVLAEYFEAWEAGREPTVQPENAEQLLLARQAWEALGRDATLAESPETFPSEVGRFRIEKELGRGGFGVVFLANDPSTGRDVALKVPLVHVLTTPAARQRFVREAELSAPLDHPNVVPVYEAGTAGALPYIATAFVRGPTLQQWLKANTGKPIPCRDAAAIVAQIADGVQHAHARGVLHRDLKPGNVLLQSTEKPPRESAAPDAEREESIAEVVCTPHAPREESPHAERELAGLHAEREESIENPKSLPHYTPRITDFGLGRAIDEEDGLSRTGEHMGTANYMAPEQAAGRRRDVSVRTDVWALGAILYELLAGQLPFVAESSPAVLQKVLAEAAVRPRVVRREVPADLEAVCLKCLEKNPADRYASAEALADDLRHFLAGEPTLARPIGSIRTAWRWAKRRPAPVGLAVLALALLIAGPIATVRDAALKDTLREREAKELALNRLAIAREAAAFSAEVRRENGEKTPGWRERNTAALKRVAEISGDDLDPVSFRTDLAVTLAGSEWREVARLLPKILIGEVAFSPDGQNLALASSQVNLIGRGTVTLLGAHHLKQLHQWTFTSQDVLIEPGHDKNGPDGARSLAFSPDGKFLFMGTRSGWVHRFDVEKADGGIKSWRAHHHAVDEIIFSPDGVRLITTARHARNLKMWEVASTGKLLKTFEPNIPVGFSHQGVTLRHLGHQILFAVGSNRAMWLNPDSLEPDIRRLADDGSPGKEDAEAEWPIQHLTACPKTETFFSAYREVWIGDTRHWARTERLASFRDVTLSGDVVQCVDIDPTGRFAAASIDHEIIIWDLLSSTVVQRLTPPAMGGFTRKIRFSPDGKRLVAPGEPAMVYDLKRRDIEEAIALQGIPVRRFAVARDTNDVATVSYFEDGNSRSGGSVSLVTSRGVVRPTPGTRIDHHLSDDLSLSPDGGHIVWGHDEFWMSSYARDKVPVDRRFVDDTSGDGFSYSFDPDGQHFWAARGRKVVRHVATSSDIDLTFNVPRTAGNINNVASLTSGSHFVLAGNRDGHLDVLDARNAKLEFTLTIAGGSILSAVALSQDETLAVVGTLDGRVVCVALPDGKEVAAFTPHTGRVNGVALSPDNRLMATAGNDGKLRLWIGDGAKWDPLADLPTGRKPVKQVHIDAAGQKLYVLLAGERGVRVWHLDKLKEAFDQYGVGW